MTRDGPVEIATTVAASTLVLALFTAAITPFVPLNELLRGYLAWAWVYVKDGLLVLVAGGLVLLGLRLTR